MRQLLCTLFHDWWHPSHRAEFTDCGMGQKSYCGIYQCWRKR